MSKTSRKPTSYHCLDATVTPERFHLFSEILITEPFSCLQFAGWEYTVEATLASYGPVEKVYHLCRRRRWIRERKFVKETKKDPDVCCVIQTVILSHHTI